jgi:hypothetical protein
MTIVKFGPNAKAKDGLFGHVIHAITQEPSFAYLIFRLTDVPPNFAAICGWMLSSARRALHFGSSR